MELSLDIIKKPVAREIDEFEKYFRGSVKSNVVLLDKIMFYIVKRKGKQVRPLFVFLSAMAAGGVTERTHTAASLIELLHTASLVHDDVVDESLERRGFFSINALWKNKIAVLVGDYLLAQGLIMAVDKEEFNLLRIVSKAVKEISEGELLQIEKARRLDIKEDIYYEIIRQKTASLISAACESGASSAGASEEICLLFRRFGEEVGIAFQIKDDLFDYGVDDVGKPLGIDIKEKKMTLPLIYALQNCNDSEKRHIINLIKNRSKEKKVIAEVIRFVNDKGGLIYATQKMEEFTAKARKTLRQIGSNEAIDSLEAMIQYVTERKK